MSATPNPRIDGHDTSAHSRGARNAARRLIAVTRDTALAQALQELASEVSVVIVSDVSQFTSEMLQQGGELALLDSAAVEEPLPGIVDALTSQFPDLRLMVAGQSTEQGLLASRIADGTVFRFVHKPATAQRLQVFVGAAAREPSRRVGVAGAEGVPPRPPSRLAVILAGVAAVCVAAAAAWFFWPEGAGARLNARDLAKVEDMVQRAREASVAGRFVSFDGTSSAELYRDILELDSENEQALTGLDNSLDSAIRSARQSLAAGELDDATNAMEAVRLIAPTRQGLQELIDAVDAETTRRLADATAREEMAERQRQIQAALEQMTDRIRAGALIEPAADNAIVYFQTAQGVSAGDPAVRTARNQLVGALVAAGDRSLQARSVPDAQRFAAAAGRINSSASGLSALLGRIEAAQTPAAAPAPVSTQTPRPARPTPSAAEVARTLEAVVPTTAVEAPTPVPDPQPAPAEQPAASVTPAEPAWVPGEGVVPAGRLKVVRAGEAEFPDEARARQISGWVEMEFTVARNGSVKDVTITASEPRRTFDSAASRAIRGYRFEPVLKDGEPVEQRAHLRMRFNYQE